MNNQQKQQLIRHMNENQDDNWAEHARWATTNFGINVTDKECAELYIQSLF